MNLDTIVDRLFAHSHLIGDTAAIWYQDKRTWKHHTWAQYADAVEKFAGALIGLGFEPGDCTVIMGNNCPEWLFADVGTMAARGCPAGIYQTSTPEQVSYVANHCEAKVFVLQNMDYFQALELDTKPNQFPHVKKFVLIHDAELVEHPDVISFADFLATGDEHRAQAKQRRAELLGTDLATLIYTSGTTGPPKGVMLSNDNLGWTALAAISAVGDVQTNDCVVSYLPLSHIAEQLFSLHLAITAGYSVWCCEDISKIKDTLVIARPTLFLAVPRVWEKFRTALEMKFADTKGAKRLVVDFALKAGREAGEIIVEKGEDALPLSLKLQNTLAQQAFGSKLRAALGLDRLRIAVSGAAPIGKDVLDFFLSAGIIIHEVYGQSEGSGPTSFNFPKPGQRRIGSVGKVFPGCELKISEDGEILMRGPNVFMGYYKDPLATAETLVDDWLHSGDVGRLDADGFLYITDRKKDLIITAGGKNVAPQNIEKFLRTIDGIGNTVVIGDRRKFLAALVTIDAERGPALAKEHGWPTELEELAVHPGFLDFIQAEIDRINTLLARYENIRKFAVIANDFTTESGELTPTQKVKRKVVNERHAAVIEGFYEGLD